MFFEEPIEEHIPIKKPFECKAEANKESFLKALKQEKKRYDDGYKYVSEWVRIRGKVWKKGRWVKED